MSKIVWDEVGKRFYETGVDHGVLYVMTSEGKYEKGVAWNGLSGVTESPSGAEPSAVYADNMKYLNLMSAEEFGATIEAYTYPPEFAECNGEAVPTDGVIIGQQTRKLFGFSYRTKIGNDTDGSDHGYKLHLIYNCLAGVSEKGYQTINDSPEAMTLSWEITTTPVDVTDHKPTACLTIDSTTSDPTKLAELEKVLYGDGSKEARLPMPDEVIEMMKKSE